ncbi:MAG: (d)CMP kinase [Methanobrevibacter boviskoreani]|jgi:cytidylate kinase|uniref:(d)CMP kinase n=1 Tax=Methanobrevibacter TaxID=2172 RepID=UPI000334868B|nr:MULTISPECIES: AAA family ATPase [Methanobrevibacter]AGN17131.1 cytidylate kinase Cmk [Methanobrevibacter sp. AbM4]MCI6774501.1 AAA family ATPase [Methanobrevibacter boviskoreani]MCI6929663.1 AAA family ATPase [Methanobrevibacter boviskoreani]MDD6256433.1 AAA family ATPase [Methanobrevibacter boviskoreani]MDY5614018.1 AAA family ATPase [Methanobrevibacter boviskoreani]
MIITIGGPAGSGTTTAAKVLSENLNIPYLSTGSIFRDMAKEKGMSVLEFSKFAENNTDIDKEIDRRQAELAYEAGDIVVEGRLSAYFIEADLKIWLTAPLDVRAKRVHDRENKSIEQAVHEIKIREESEASRYKEIHNIDLYDYNIYDVVINSDSFNPESISQIITDILKVI